MNAATDKNNVTTDKLSPGFIQGMGIVEVANAASLAAQAGNIEGAIDIYQIWLSGNETAPTSPAVYYNLSALLIANKQTEASIPLLIRSLSVKADFQPTYQLLASAYEKAGQAAAALTVLLELRKLLADISTNTLQAKVAAFRNIARLSNDPAIGENALRQTVELNPTQLDLVHHWANYRHSRCVWPVLHPVGRYSVRDLEQMMLPLFISMTVDDPRRLFEASQIYMDREIAEASFVTVGNWPTPPKKKKKRLKVAYLSSDLRYHPIGYLMEDIFALHDQSRYDISVYNIGDPADDPLKQKIHSAVSAWHEVRTLSDAALAKKIVADEIDILLDINGHTKFQRPRLLAMKPAPIAVNWLGYPGTMGVGCHQYIIADNFIIPPSHERFYGEKVVRLPCYQPNSALWEVPPIRYSKKLLGLPEHAFVFCCFNGMVKITPEVFRRWMTILKAVPNSVLWLRGSGTDAPVQLRKEATAQGVDPGRIVVLEFQPHTEYYACHRYADLFLDTFPYGAHTTASDALRMGVPIVTLAGEGFPSRVCGSLLHSVGLPELVCTTPSQYIDLAIALARDTKRLATIKKTLQTNLPTSALFDTAGLVKHLEQLFETMWKEYCSGKYINTVPPAPIFAHRS
ncbi:hypothetical protein MASR1M60_21550 [Rhodocyclaceae bacterium]